ncbi:hypothetical protein A2331_03705 [Candidatus Falkowbacteria bacterium RIFOXYB2_FULL_34_18]|uniref:PDZ domain-containing protein n=1 Tax=Candidatus Falkowbacteria bacterium RIFOXYD2_FULL_34_120 TaxID=1798007 RepID=A0A1F5TSI0_9BACT|nr:MAG: hypothetical protein A2331_03705 [Candidatus Falkowbacteria bacterium RIFOXYB2_FULL_34_18]OGF30074.1 MAG: hypothetical protein A2500_04745 [Candidatus Falkowbacteria bacterium RIFOXYC12_FULL_34_55]OGF37592.1 MAG: hypothetical protein A2466_02100 [Candidatus Falkowbacteria bacterium RIFOXYC2_FULL_34_220]OGF39348.1 MAG: hypothetical protein A2515_02515 [Candidatus Falkowbacteria bacterium RIFOXYD12_FULL_34_57]OGF41853.1 MAG: hypothetical protein A2531_05500 [Candidatus Falkowbacteria bact
MRKLLRFSLVGFFVCFFIFLGCKEDEIVSSQKEDIAPILYYTQVSIKKENYRIFKEIIESLNDYHYVKKEINENFSKDVLEEYLKGLDFSKTSFFSFDIAEFRKHNFSLKKDTDNDVDYAYQIYNLFQLRKLERIFYALNRLEDGFAQLDLETDEQLETDFSKIDWPAGELERRELWRKILKNEYLQLHLSGKTDDEIKRRLIRKYQNELKRLKQTTSDDVFSMFTNSICALYDPHTQYMSPMVKENFDISMKLSLCGIGAILKDEDGYIEIVSLIPDSPADKSKELFPGDRIVGVGQGEKGEIVNVVEADIRDVVQMVKGEKDTVVRLEIIPVKSKNNQQTKIISIKRDEVQLKEQAAQKSIKIIKQNGKDYKIGIITIPSFYMDFNAYTKGESDYRSVSRDVKEILEDFQKENIDGVIVDIRGNGGGALNEAVDLTDLFIANGSVVQVKMFNHDVKCFKTSDVGNIIYGGPLLLMVDVDSASASEIFAGAIQDYGRGIIVGSSTFGKGTVQELSPLIQGVLKITIAKFYRVSGESTQYKGVIPDIEFPNIFQGSEMGEKSLPYALPYDTIKPTDFKKYTDLSSLISNLKEYSRKRTETDADFIALDKEIKHLDKSQSTLISLKESTRKAEVGADQAKKSEFDGSKQEESGQEKKDPFLRESINIIIDMIISK